MAIRYTPWYKVLDWFDYLAGLCFMVFGGYLIYSAIIDLDTLVCSM